MTHRALRQMVLDFDHRPAHGASDFLVARCNRRAVSCIDRWPDWQAPGLVIHGPPGCGKTHLAKVWSVRSGARVVPANRLDSMDAFAARHSVVIDAVDERTDEQALFHLYNNVVERQGYLLITARRGPAQLDLQLADLRSRIRALPSVEVTAPDDGLLSAVMVKLFADRQIEVPPEVVDYLINRVERSFESAYDIVAALDRHALERRRRITMRLAREVLASRVPQ